MYKQPKSDSSINFKNKAAEHFLRQGQQAASELASKGRSQGNGGFGKDVKQMYHRLKRDQSDERRMRRRMGLRGSGGIAQSGDMMKSAAAMVADGSFNMSNAFRGMANDYTNKNQVATDANSGGANQGGQHPPYSSFGDNGAAGQTPAYNPNMRGGVDVSTVSGGEKSGMYDSEINSLYGGSIPTVDPVTASAENAFPTSVGPDLSGRDVNDADIRIPSPDQLSPDYFGNVGNNAVKPAPYNRVQGMSEFANPGNAALIAKEQAEFTADGTPPPPAGASIEARGSNGILDKRDFSAEEQAATAKATAKAKAKWANRNKPIRKANDPTANAYKKAANKRSQTRSKAGKAATSRMAKAEAKASSKEASRKAESKQLDMIHKLKKTHPDQASDLMAQYLSKQKKGRKNASTKAGDANLKAVQDMINNM